MKLLQLDQLKKESVESLVDSFDKALVYGLYPFIAGDLIKLYIASNALPAAWTLVNKFKRS